MIFSNDDEKTVKIRKDSVYLWGFREYSKWVIYEKFLIVNDVKIGSRKRYRYYYRMRNV